ncbi:hypothetical protein RRF57_011272 [Xylaria bambusicola]|uniref:Uncharacterized protein n=1 Tax=Xylaria bambusicola TaxID=326684 RepID=A0AAN7UMJ8_9PEZI
MAQRDEQVFIFKATVVVRQAREDDDYVGMTKFRTGRWIVFCSIWYCQLCRWQTICGEPKINPPSFPAECKHEDTSS